MYYKQANKVHNSLKLKGFTLAEVLITLAIIGIVAALTIPSLVNNIQDQQFKSAWKKNFALLSQVVQITANDNGGSLKGLLIEFDSNHFRDVFLSHLKYVRTCYEGSASGVCWHYNDGNHWFTGDGTGITDAWYNYAGIVLIDGTLLQFSQDSATCTANGGGTPDNIYCGSIIIDVNGFKTPNKVGKDIFSVHVLENKLLPTGINDWSTGHCGGSWDGWGCSATVLLE